MDALNNASPRPEQYKSEAAHFPYSIDASVYCSRLSDQQSQIFGFRACPVFLTFKHYF
jgi:hypothetical protein